MDTLTTNNCSKSSSKSNSNSSGSSATSSSMDLGKQTSKQRQRGQKLSRSRSLLQLLSRHLGRHFQHHHHQKDTLYSSQDDIRSSSTDSFSLSYERASRLEVLHGGSSLDLENTSRTSSSSSSSSSPNMEFYENNTHIYVEAVYRPGSAMDELHPHYDDSSSTSSSSSSNVDEEEQVDENENLEQLKPHNNLHPRSASAASATSGTNNKAGLHQSRISISSSVSRMLQHFSTSAATTATASLRSFSCSSTPLKQPRAAQRELSSSMAMTLKKSLTPHHNNSGGSNSSNCNSNNSSSSSNSSSCSSHSSSSKSSKKDKKQQSILRPPVQYVYMKGMSGLYSRVPQYAVCCPYTLQHMY